jgi:hypothetical protein
MVLIANVIQSPSKVYIVGAIVIVDSNLKLCCMHADFSSIWLPNFHPFFLLVIIYGDVTIYIVLCATIIGLCDGAAFYMLA